MKYICTINICIIVWSDLLIQDGLDHSDNRGLQITNEQFSKLGKNLCPETEDLQTDILSYNMFKIILHVIWLLYHQSE